MDELPIQLCYQCASTIIAWDTLIQGCQEAEKKLKSLLDIKSPCKDEVEEVFEPETGLAVSNEDVDSDDEPLITKTQNKTKAVITSSTSKNVLQETKDSQNALHTGVKVRLKAKTNHQKSNCDEKRKTDSKVRRLECPICGKVIVRHLERHMSTHSNADNVKLSCRLCGNTYNNNQLLQEDLYKHAETWFELKTDVKENGCRICGKNFTLEVQLTNHLLSHLKRKTEVKEQVSGKKRSRFKADCDICGKIITKKYTMKRHLASHSKEKLFTCEQCGKQFTHDSGLQRHVSVIHEGIRRYKCPICSSVFSSNTELRHHQESHTDPRPFQCDQCGRTFKCHKDLYHHRKYHHTVNGLRELCKQCNRYFSSASALKRHHRVVHLGLKEFQCHVCSTQLSTKQYLQEHLRIHSDERPEVCSVCGKTFQLNGNLRQHMKTHMEKTQICDVCGKGFTRRCHLIVHMGSHRGIRTPSCNICGQNFILKCDLEKHVKTDHAF